MIFTGTSNTSSTTTYAKARWVGGLARHVLPGLVPLLGEVVFPGDELCTVAAAEHVAACKRVDVDLVVAVTLRRCGVAAAAREARSVKSPSTAPARCHRAQGWR